MHLSGTVVLLPARLFYRGTPKHYSVVKCTTDLFFVSLAKAEMARLIASFANADGGIIIVGLREDFTIVGVPEDTVGLTGRLF